MSGEFNDNDWTPASWVNYKTHSFDPRQPDTDEIALEYIPQHPAAQGLYGVYRDMGLDIVHAMLETLKDCAQASNRPAEKKQGGEDG